MARIVNGLLGAAAVILFAVHGISMGLFLAGVLPYSYTRKYFGYALFVCVILHAVISLVLNVFEGGAKKKDKYLKANKVTYLQRLLGVILIFLIFLHIGAYGYHNDESLYILKEPTIKGVFCQIGLALIAGIHFIIGFPRAMISIGYIREPLDLKNQKNFVYMIFAFTAALAIYGSYHYFLLWQG